MSIIGIKNTLEIFGKYDIRYVLFKKESPLAYLLMNNAGWIRTERESRGLSQANLARFLAISQPKLSQWETGKAIASEDEAARIKQVLAEFDTALKGNQLPSGIRPRSKRRSAQRLQFHVTKRSAPALRPPALDAG